MFLIWGLLSLQTAYAWNMSSGGYGTTVSYRTSAGNHRTHVGAGGWFQRCRDRNEMQSCWQGGVSLSTNGQKIPGGTMRTTVVRPTISMGYFMGSQPTKVGFSAGAGAQVISGGVNGDVVLVQPGGYGMISLQKPLSDDWLLWGSNGYFMRAWGVDVDISVGVGKRW